MTEQELQAILAQIKNVKPEYADPDIESIIKTMIQSSGFTQSQILTIMALPQAHLEKN